MRKSDYDETRAVARLPNLDIEILHRRPWEGEGEELTIRLSAHPSFEAFGRYLEQANPFLLWPALMEAAWMPWLNGLAALRALALPGERQDGVRSD
ncbi:MAG TPA: hypothetical protein VFA23_10955 [Dongiaceae bacterium]|nr:hypothetical protein [Dongiaceae bacterium]